MGNDVFKIVQLWLSTTKYSVFILSTPSDLTKIEIPFQIF